MSADKHLIERCVRSEERAQYELYEECYSLMKGICMRYLYDRSEVPAVMNQSFLKVVNSLDKFDQSKSFKGWVSRIVINTALDHLRKKKRERRVESVDPGELPLMQTTRSHSWNDADQRLDAEALLNMLNKLPDRTREVFNLFAIDGYSHDEIANLLNISSGTSKWHVSKAREQLKQLIIEQQLKESRAL